MPVPIEVSDFRDFFVIRNCINGNIVDAENAGDGRTRYLQYNWWGLAVPDPTKITGDIVFLPTMPRACDLDVSNPVVNQFPSSVRVGTMKNRRNIMGGGYNANF